MQEFIAVDKHGGAANAVTSLEELIQAAARVSTGKPIPVDCPECEHHFILNLGVDSKVLVFLLERLLGKPTETKDVNIRSEQIVELLRDETVNARLEIVALDPRERAERQRIIEAELIGD